MKGFGRASCPTAPGPGSTVTRRVAASYSQQLWRFCRNKRVGFAASIQPLIQRVRDGAPPAGVLLAVHDGSTLAFATHASKTDRRQLTHATDVGYVEFPTNSGQFLAVGLVMRPLVLLWGDVPP